MTRLCTLPLAFLLAFTAHAQKNPKSKEETCTIFGMVIKMADSAPLRKARLLLKSVDDPSRNISAVSDAEGRFALKSIDPGPYRLTVTRIGFVTQEYGQRKPTAPGAVLTLHPGQEMKDLLFRMIPSGVISGKIFDDDGEPLPSVTVEAATQIYAEGKRTRSVITQVQTNDLGEYRLFGLSPGRYFVGSQYPRWTRYTGEDDSSSATSQGEDYAKLYYPGTADPAKAGLITVNPGEESSSIDISMRKVNVRQIRGHVYNQVTHKPGVGVYLLLLPKTVDRNSNFGDVSTQVQKADGSFALSGVLPGSYMLASFWMDDGVAYVNRQAVDVGNADVVGMAISVAPGVTITGRIVWDGRPSLEKDELSVVPQPTDIPFGFRGQVRVVHDNTFTIKEVGEGTYRAEVNGMSKDCYIKDVRYGESSGLKDGFTVTRGEPGALEIILSSRGARVQGTVRDADGLPLSGVSIVLVPDLSLRDRYSLYKTQSTDQYGNFDLHGVAPGDYKLFSWEEVEADAWQDPEFLKPFEEKGERITLQDGDHSTVKITAIHAKNPDSPKP